MTVLSHELSEFELEPWEIRNSENYIGQFFFGSVVRRQRMIRKIMLVSGLELEIRIRDVESLNDEATWNCLFYIYNL
jgi:hypothetical protein